jgi:hypothetical protein
VIKSAVCGPKPGQSPAPLGWFRRKHVAFYLLLRVPERHRRWRDSRVSTSWPALRRLFRSSTSHPGTAAVSAGFRGSVRT